MANLPLNAAIILAGLIAAAALAFCGLLALRGQPIPADFAALSGTGGGGFLVGFGALVGARAARQGAPNGLF